MSKSQILVIICVIVFGFLLSYYINKDISVALLSILKGIFAGLIAYFFKKVYETKRK